MIQKKMVIVGVLAFSVIIVCLLVASGNTSARVLHGKICINSNSEFEQIAQQEGWSGNGSSGNPYIIENYEIDGMGSGYCIYIGNTTVHFVIRNCYLYNTSSQGTIYSPGGGIVLYNVTNGIQMEL